MTAVFPADLPTPIYDGYSSSVDLGVERVEFDGNARFRRRYDNAPQEITATWRVTRAQRRDLVRFAHETGADPFVVQLRMPGDDELTRSVVARFASVLSIVPVPPDYDDVTVTLRVAALEIVVSTDALIATDGAELVDPDGADVISEETI